MDSTSDQMFHVKHQNNGFFPRGLNDRGNSLRLAALSRECGRLPKAKSAVVVQSRLGKGPLVQSTLIIIVGLF
jgi:hypothetical protein